MSLQGKHSPLRYRRKTAASAPESSPVAGKISSRTNPGPAASANLPPLAVGRLDSIMMSASDGRHHGRHVGGGGGGGPGPAAVGGSSAGGRMSGRPAGAVIRPAPVTEKSLMDSVAGFINEVQAFNAAQGTSVGAGAGQAGHNDPRIYVTWAKFEVADINDTKLFPEGMEINGKCQ